MFAGRAVLLCLLGREGSGSCGGRDAGAASAAEDAAAPEISAAAPLVSESFS